ncbi:hypothetical protein RF11_01090 [Thelohanellus kitauei]|uniref:Uncharacterized protein n=1 Tax=Thelohanellus kitauei TaxID=669202 RepID=A0A0C2MX43_THEKT|nr:hypothetical protein RF11_01090 [Thelohanellus kitauei]
MLNCDYLLAVATNSLRLFRIQPQASSIIIHEILNYKKHISEVSRVSWGLDGNFLSSLSTNGSVCCHKGGVVCNQELRQNEWVEIYEANPQNPEGQYLPKNCRPRSFQNNTTQISHLPFCLWDAKL